MSNPAPTTATAQVQSWLTLGRFGALLALLGFAAYPEVILGQQTFFFRDFGYFGYPLAFHHKQSFLSGEIPLWNPLSNCGLPFLAQWNTLVLYPGSLIYLLLPLSWSLGMFCLIHQWLGGLGMFWLARRWTGSELGAAVAGMGYAFGGLTLNSLMWPNNMAAFGWLPWVVGGVERGWREGGKAMVVGTLMGAVQMLSGAPEVILFTWVAAGTMWLMALAREGMERWPRTWRMGLMVAWVTGLCAAQLLPFFDLLLHSQRDTNFAQNAWSMPPLGWANFIVPLFHSFAANQGVFFQYDQLWTSSYYLALPLFALAAVAIWRMRRRRVWMLAVLVLASLVLALGKDGYLYGWLKSGLPFLGFLRFPIKFVILAVFCVPVLAAFGMRWLESHHRTGRGFDRRPLFTAWFAALGLTAVILWIAWRYPQPLDDWTATWRCALARLAFLTLAVGLCVAFFHPRAARYSKLWQLVLLCVLWLDAMTHVPRQNPVVPRGIYEAGLVKLEPQPRHGASRVMISRDADMYFRQTATTRGLDHYIGNRLGLFSDCNLLDDIPKVNGFYSLFLRGNEEIRELLYAPSATNLNFEPLLDLMSVSHISSTTNALEWQRRDGWLPFVTGGQLPVFVEDSRTLGALFAPFFDPRRVVILPMSEQAGLAGVGTAEVKIINDRFTAHRVDLEIEASQPACVVISQAHYHPWEARVDGQFARIIRANHAFQAVVVPGGRHRIQLHYRDNAFRLGVMVSGLALVFVLFVWLSESRRAATANMNRPIEPTS